MSNISEKLETVAQNVQKVYDKGVQDGIQSEYDKFWDAFQNYGERTNYNYAFVDVSSFWSKGFTPKYPVTILYTYSNYMFAYFNPSPVVDFSEFLKDNNIIIKTTGVSPKFVDYIPVGDSTFMDGRGITHLPKLYVSPNSFYQTFWYCTNLITIDELYFTDSTNSSSYVFFGCSKLENIKFSGVFKRRGLDLHFCTKLTHDSIISLINILYDYSGTTTTNSITLGTTNLGKLTDEQKAIAINKGWTLS